ncbi:MAG: hypothetical protein KGV46_02945 [Pasteurella sp.]|nr:hypothetical protein [Pasteurella sp.]
MDNELALLGKSETIADCCTVTDSLIIARHKLNRVMMSRICKDIDEEKIPDLMIGYSYQATDF